MMKMVMDVLSKSQSQPRHKEDMPKVHSCPKKTPRRWKNNLPYFAEKSWMKT